MAFPWTKFQDFYLRLGFLKTLAIALDPERRSALNQAIVRRLTHPLFEPARKYVGLWSSVADKFPKDDADDPKKFTTVAEASLVAGNCPSLLFAITPDTSYKILDWGHDVGFLGRGNQIAERAIVLRALMDVASADRFLAGDPTAWNPFVLSAQERLFFLYHIAEIDRLTLLLVEGLAESGAGRALESGDAARLMCRRFFTFLTECERSLLPRETPVYRTALDLACVIADELGINEYSHVCGGTSGIRRIGRPTKRAPLSRAGQNPRRTTKSADHQTIPRFEQLTDLGFITKLDASHSRSPMDDISIRKRWRYLPTDACSRWGTCAVSGSGAPNFLHQGFAHAAVRAYSVGSPLGEPDDHIVAQYLWRAYETVHRPVGHTPFDSVALLALIYAAVDGIAIEMDEFHSFMLRLKQREVLPNHAFFASGNEIEKMFILLKTGFLDAFAASVELSEGNTK